jgi:hypothetical protein
MKKCKSAEVFVLALGLAAAVLMSQIGFADANPFMHLPVDPHTIVTVQYPSDSSVIYGEDINLRVRVDTSQWYMITYKGPPNLAGDVTQICCLLDGQTTVLLHLTGFSRNPLARTSSETYSASLKGLSPGEHSLKVEVTTSGHYNHKAVVDGNTRISSAFNSIVDSSEPIYFTIQPQATPIPTPSAVVTPAVAAPSTSPVHSTSQIPTQQPILTSSVSSSFPEFPTWVVMSLFIVAAVGAVTYGKRRKSTQNNL